MEMNRLIKEAQAREHVELLLLDAGGHRAPGVEDLSDEARVGAKEWLRNHGLIVGERLSGDFDLNYDGQMLADQLNQSRTSGERRWDLAMKLMLPAIYEYGNADSVMKVDGLAVTDTERDIVYDRIEKWGLGKPLKAWGGKVIRVLPKPRLAEALQVSGSLKDYFENQTHVNQSVTNQTNISGGTVGGVMTGGSGNTVHVQQTLSSLEAEGVKAKLDEILQVINDVDGIEPLVEVMQQARSEVDTPEATKPSIKKKVVDGISVAGDLSSIAQTAPLIASVLPMLAQLVSML